MDYKYKSNEKNKYLSDDITKLHPGYTPHLYRGLNILLKIPYLTRNHPNNEISFLIF